jgi:hypothetical protein
MQNKERDAIDEPFASLLELNKVKVSKIEGKEKSNRGGAMGSEPYII